MVAPNDEVRGAKVLADDGVPERLARAAHAHRQRQEGERGHAVRVGAHDGLVDAHARVVVDVARLGQADDGLNQHVGLVHPRRPDRQLAVSAVHRVARLEGDDLAPGELLEELARLGGRVCGVSGADAMGDGQRRAT